MAVSDEDKLPLSSDREPAGLTIKSPTQLRMLLVSNTVYEHERYIGSLSYSTCALTGMLLVCRPAATSPCIPIADPSLVLTC